MAMYDILLYMHLKTCAVEEERPCLKEYTLWAPAATVYSGPPPETVPGTHTSIVSTSPQTLTKGQDETACRSYFGQCNISLGDKSEQKAGTLQPLTITGKKMYQQICLNE